MRFRVNLGMAVWFYAIISPLWILGGIRLGNATNLPFQRTYLVTAVVYLLLFAFYFSLQRFTYWDILDTGIFERRLWKTKSIPWNEIARVIPWQPGKRPMPNSVEILYHRGPPISDGGSLIVYPTHLPQFLEALHTHAPHAIYDL